MGDIANVIAKISKLNSAIESALEIEVADAAIKAVQESAEENVYSYVAEPRIMAQRRKTSDGGLIDPNSFDTHVEDGDTLVITNVANPQNGGGEKLVNIVESGDKAWHQPYPRPFMEEGRDKVVDSGEAVNALVRGLKRQGISL